MTANLGLAQREEYSDNVRSHAHPKEEGSAGPTTRRRLGRAQPPLEVLSQVEVGFHQLKVHSRGHWASRWDGIAQSAYGSARHAASAQVTRQRCIN